MGVDPGPFTLRELTSMAQGRADLEWDIGRAIVATVLNVNRKKGTQPIKPDDLKPRKAGKAGKGTKLVVQALMDMAKAAAERKAAKGKGQEAA